MRGPLSSCAWSPDQSATPCRSPDRRNYTSRITEIRRSHCGGAAKEILVKRLDEKPFKSLHLILMRGPLSSCAWSPDQSATACRSPDRRNYTSRITEIRRSHCGGAAKE